MKRVLVGASVLAVFGVGVGVGRAAFAPRAGLTQTVTASQGLEQVRQGDAKQRGALSAQRQGRLREVRDGQSVQAAILEAGPGDTIQIFPGTYKETVYVDRDGISLIGVIENGHWPLLDGEGVRNDAILYSGNDVRIENLHITRYKGNAIMGQAGNNFVIRHNWVESTGVYGIFPEYGQNGLIDYNVLSGIEDAAIYVGMCDNIHVAHNEVFANVAGIEVENSRHVIVENNVAYDNTAGLLAFVIPGLPIKTTADVIFRNNIVYGNNRKNFGAVGSVIAGVPAGTGVLIMAADDVVLDRNIIRDHKNIGIAILDHASADNMTSDPDAEPNPDRVQILDNVMMNNGTDPIPEIKALMVASLSSDGPDIAAAGGGVGSCILDAAKFRTLGLGGYGPCSRRDTQEVATYLLDEPAPSRGTDLPNKAQLVFSAICAGCHAYNARIVGPPVVAIQALYLDNPQGIADYIEKPTRRRPDFPPMPPQAHLSPELRTLVAEYLMRLEPSTAN